MFRDDPGERLEFYRPAAAPGIEILKADNSFEPWHVYHEQYAICAARVAANTTRYRGKVEVFNDRSVSFFEPGECHRNLRSYKHADFKVVFVQPWVFERESAELGGSAAPHFDLFPRAPAPGLFDTVYSYCESVESGADALEQESRLACCIERFLASAERPVRKAHSTNPAGIARAKRYLADRYNEAVTLGELAAISGMSKYHLLRDFARNVGLPPHAYQVHMRIERARALLRRRLLPVEVAHTVGFADQSHFTRHFKRIWGITPAAYARLT